jgi:hypothetical protein
VWKVWGVDLATPRKKDAKPKLARRKNAAFIRENAPRAILDNDSRPKLPKRLKDRSTDESYDENVIEKSIGVSDIKTMPRVIYAAFFATSVLSGLTLLWGLVALCTSFAKWAVVFFSALATLAALITAICAQILFPTLVYRVHNYRVVAKNNAGGGVLIAKLGVKALAGLWTLALLSLLTTFLLAVTLHSHRKERAGKNGKRHSMDKDSRLKEYQLSPTAGSSRVPTVAVRNASPLPGIIRRTTNKMFGTAGLTRYDDTSYETLRVVGAEPRGKSRSSARSRDPSRSRAGSIEEKKESMDGAEERTEDRYKPYRHHTGS